MSGNKLKTPFKEEIILNLGDSEFIVRDYDGRYFVVTDDWRFCRNGRYFVVADNWRFGRSGVVYIDGKLDTLEEALSAFKEALARKYARIFCGWRSPEQFKEIFEKRWQEVVNEKHLLERERKLRRQLQEKQKRWEKVIESICKKHL